MSTISFFTLKSTCRPTKEMSARAKVTFGITLAVTVATIVTVHITQDAERAALQQGPIKDKIRMAEKNRQIEENAKLRRNEEEYLLQKKLTEQYSSVQPLTGEIVVGIDKK